MNYFSLRGELPAAVDSTASHDSEGSVLTTSTIFAVTEGGEVFVRTLALGEVFRTSSLPANLAWVQVIRHISVTNIANPAKAGQTIQHDLYR
ncbi:MAG: hypothetical protein BWX92_04047 [Deltaproteobacteria bacterium ADurb.Bin135]|nr:MAG: hypothetical protein BWX92_04047 [Deltaproteobacteria bacterium ADurb.Bin135]